METLCELRNVRRSFVLHGQAVEVLRGVDLRIAEGDRVALTGASGSGKSTLLAIMGLIDDSFEGTYRVKGADVREATASRRNDWRLRTFGFAFQDLHLVPSLTAQENVELPAHAAGGLPTQAASRASELLAAAGLGARAGHRPSQLSGGERRRVAFARALVNRPRLLLVDEPTSELDAASTAGVLSLLDRAVSEGASLVAATHDTRLIAGCSRVFGLRKGRLELLSGAAKPRPKKKV